ncbi:MAG: carboxymuconolactone decarboxylase family protein [Thiomicrospira sp.]|nr:carboxymuconolactone decarboxylase family protein [Thiomicrospira sp.]
MIEKIEEAFGFVPNMMAKMLTSEPLTQAYLDLNSLFDQTGFSCEEKQIILLANSRINGCQYCLAAHRKMALMHKVDTNIIDQVSRRAKKLIIQSGRLWPNLRLKW